jgi:hypothetical protein
MMKQILLIFCFLFSSIVYGESLDSINRFSVEFRINPTSAMFFRFVDYPIFDEPSDFSERYFPRWEYAGVFFNEANVSFNYKLLNRIIGFVGIGHTQEIYQGMRAKENKDKLSHSVSKLEYRYLSLPVGILLNPLKNTSRFNFYIQGGLSFDFIYYDYREKDYYQAPYQDKLDRNLKFNRIVPYINIGFEWYNRARTFSFKMGSAFVSTSIYQLRNTSEYIKNCRYTPIIFGLSYHF